MSTQESRIKEVIIESNDKKRSADMTASLVEFHYFEDIFSPTITAKMVLINANQTIAPVNDEGEAKGELMGVYNGLPIRGGERVKITIEANSDSNKDLEFNYEDTFLYVSSVSDIISNSQRELFTLHLTSRASITNETSRVGGRFDPGNPISSSVEKILKEKLGLSPQQIEVEKTTNKYGFIGNMRKPFTVLTWLASKSVPNVSGDATAGFLFYQTQKAYHFRSIDKLIMQNPVAAYLYSETVEAFDNEGNKIPNDFKILRYQTERNQNLIEKLKLGAYSSYRTFFNPLTFTFTDPQKGVFRHGDYKDKVNNLGDDFKLPKLSETTVRDLGDVPTRIFTSVLDVGTLHKTPKDFDARTVNADQAKYQSQSVMRYNTLFTQILSMTVPLNTNLIAGDVIKCSFPKISEKDKSQVDDEQSGLYMIKELCHYYNTEHSYTSMKLVRDTYGNNPEAREEESSQFNEDGTRKTDSRSYTGGNYLDSGWGALF